VKSFYALTRDLHLYLGLFISPMVLVFAVSVFFLVHAWVPGATSSPMARTVREVAIPSGVDRLNGREQIDALRPVLDALGVHGEVNFVRRISAEHRLVIPVMIPGREVSVDLNTETREAAVTDRGGSIWSALVYLHKMPGQHNANIRGNWIFLRIWKFLSDTTVYIVLFLSLTGIYLWAVLRAERRVGWCLIVAGACSCCGLVYALIR
jgi:hypothetical protein